MAAPIVATYTFVNPVIALLLGWWVLSEQVTWISLCGAALVVSSIVMLLSHAHAAPEVHPSATSDEPTDITVAKGDIQDSNLPRSADLRLTTRTVIN